MRYMKLRVVRSAPELHVALFAFLLNLPWEFLQVPLYVGMPTMPHWQAVQACAQASLGDVLIALTAYWAVSGWRRRRHWLRDYGAKEILGFVLVGVGLTVALEWHATIEPPRLYRRLHILRGWSYELTKTIFFRSPGASCSISP